MDLYIVRVRIMARAMVWVRVWASDWGESKDGVRAKVGKLGMVLTYTAEQQSMYPFHLCIVHARITDVRNNHL